MIEMQWPFCNYQAGVFQLLKPGLISSKGQVERLTESVRLGKTMSESLPSHRRTFNQQQREVVQNLILERSRSFYKGCTRYGNTMQQWKEKMKVGCCTYVHGTQTIHDIHVVNMIVQSVFYKIHGAGQMR
jgi:hypothetical protein